MPQPERIPASPLIATEGGQDLASRRYMAGRVAHDLNNYLTAILGYGELLEGLLTPGSKGATFLAEMLHAGGKARDFTRQLQAFSGRLVLDPERVDVNDLIIQGEEQIRRVLGDRIDLELTLDSAAPPVDLDRQYGVQMLRWMAQDAARIMNGLGRMCITTAAARTETPDAAFCLVRIDDTVPAPAPPLRLRYFEPFTPGDDLPKAVARAGVAGVVEQHGGTIHVDESPQGTRVIHILLPAAL